VVRCRRGTQEILLLISPIISAQRSLAVVAEGLYHDLGIHCLNSPDCKRQLSRRHLLADSGIGQIHQRRKPLERIRCIKVLQVPT
jgi:hypothetical protein